MKEKIFFRLIASFRKTYPEIRQENKLFNERADQLSQSIEEKSKDKAVVLSNLRRAVLLVTQSLKVGQEPEAASTGNLFNELYGILTSTDEIEFDEEDERKLSEINLNQGILNIK